MIHVTFLLLSLFASGSCLFQFNQQREFTILQLTDQHYCSSSSNDKNTMKLTKQLISSSQPDLIVLTGDIISATGEDSKSFKKCWEKAIQPLNEAGIPYAYLQGNHDNAGEMTKEEIVELDSTNPLSLRNESEGIPNQPTFYVPIYSSNNQSRLAANLWMFDSGSVGCNGEELHGYGCVEESTMDWYDEESKKIKDEYGTNVHHIAFFHIPLQEYLELRNTEPIYGFGDEEICCSYVNTGLFDRILKNGDITATFVGHDHWNDFGGWYKGVELVYGRKSGYGGYGSLRGARVIKLKEGTNAEGQPIVIREHYVIFENGDIGYPQPLRLMEERSQTDCRPYYFLTDLTNPIAANRSDLQVISIVSLFMCIFVLVQ